MSYLTYAHFKPDGSIFYIGKGTMRRANSPIGRNIAWQRTVEKYGSYKTEILGSWDTEKEAFEHEIFLIDTFREMGYKLTNIANGGEGSSGFRHTEDHKRLLSEKMKLNNPMSNLESRQKHLIAVKEAMNRPEVKLHQRKARIGKKFSSSHVESLKSCHPMRPCIINGVEYKSLMEASRAIGVRHGTLHRWLNNPLVKHNKKYRHIIECRWID
jgi:hypothetical protein